jgi:hypothetical protein
MPRKGIREIRERLRTKNYEITGHADSEFHLSAVQEVSSPLTLSVAASAAKSKRGGTWHPSTSLRYAQDERLETACCTGHN